ncbi:hypothetical protein C8F01DRAFT_664407 [Mycena amicta]|nr:hypothetical protein C8F01DRAFT_664407 [Mycena amicta]
MTTPTTTRDFELVLLRASQWEDADLNLPLYAFRWVLESSPFSSLRRLRLFLDSEKENRQTAFPNELDTCHFPDGPPFPALVNIYLNLGDQPHIPIPVAFRNIWSFLRVCTLEGFDAKEILPILFALSPGAQLRFIRCRSKEARTVSPHTLRLSALSFDFCDFATFTKPVFDSVLDTPQLQHLKVSLDFIMISIPLIIGMYGCSNPHWHGRTSSCCDSREYKS